MELFYTVLKHHLYWMSSIISFKIDISTYFHTGVFIKQLGILFVIIFLFGFDFEEHS